MQITAEIRRHLLEVLGPDALLEDEGDLQRYGRDETPGLAHPADLVVRPQNAEEVAVLLRYATENALPLIPRGAGTGVVGGALPMEGGIVLSLEKMNRIVEIDEGNMMAVVEPAVITGELQREVEARGLFYPPDPASLDSCSIGGNVATGAGGPRAVKYGVTKDYVCGLEVVVPTGEVLRLGGKIVKNATGYHLLDLFVGSEGTLGVITEITLRLLTLPPCRTNLLVPFRDLQEASEAVAAIVRSRRLPSVLEFMDSGSLLASRRFLDREFPFADAGAHLLIEIDGDGKEAVQAAYEAIGEICLEHGAEDVLVADTRSAQERLWEARRAIGEAVKSQNRDVGKQDVVVPRMAIPELVRRLNGIGAESGVSVVCFGHAGDGNVHVNMLQGDLEDEEWRGRLAALYPSVIETVYSLGGVLSGEHGIGWLKKGHLARFLPAKHLELLRGIKRTFDPAGILNPGKVIDLNE
jgi:glycolate oxidase